MASSNNNINARTIWHGATFPHNDNVANTSNRSGPNNSFLDHSKKFFVANMAFTFTAQDVKNWFGRFGIVNHFKIVYDNNGKSKGYGFLYMQTSEGAKAVEYYANSFGNKITMLGRNNVHCQKDDKARTKNFSNGNNNGNIGVNISSHQDAPEVTGHFNGNGYYRTDRTDVGIANENVATGPMHASPEVHMNNPVTGGNPSQNYQYVQMNSDRQAPVLSSYNYNIGQSTNIHPHAAQEQIPQVGTIDNNSMNSNANPDGAPYNNNSGFPHHDIIQSNQYAESSTSDYQTINGVYDNQFNPRNSQNRHLQPASHHAVQQVRNITSQTYAGTPLISSAGPTYVHDMPKELHNYSRPSSISTVNNPNFDQNQQNIQHPPNSNNVVVSTQYPMQSQGQSPTTNFELMGNRLSQGDMNYNRTVINNARSFGGHNPSLLQNVQMQYNTIDATERDQRVYSLGQEQQFIQGQQSSNGLIQRNDHQNHVIQQNFGGSNTNVSIPTQQNSLLQPISQHQDPNFFHQNKRPRTHYVMQQKSINGSNDYLKNTNQVAHSAESVVIRDTGGQVNFTKAPSHSIRPPPPPPPPPPPSLPPQTNAGNNKKVLLSNLPKRTEPTELVSFLSMSLMKTPSRCTLEFDLSTNKNLAHLEFPTVADANAVIGMTQSRKVIFKGHTLMGSIDWNPPTDGVNIPIGSGAPVTSTTKVGSKQAHPSRHY